MSGSNKGFTLIELIIIVVILAIIVFLIFISLNSKGSYYNSSDASEISGLKSMVTAFEMYTFKNQGKLPSGIPILPSPFITSNVAASGVGSGYNIITKSKGVPNCTQAGSYSTTSCVSVSSGTLIYNEISKYLKNSQSGTFYAGINSADNTLVVFVTGMQRSQSQNPDGYYLAFETYRY